MNKKIYFVAEAKVDGDIIQSDKFNLFVNPENNDQIFSDVFQITEYRDFEQYKNKEDFIVTVLSMAASYFDVYGDNVKDISIVAIDADTNVFLWGGKFNVVDDDKFQYAILDWKSKGIFKFQDDDMTITIK